LRRQRQNRLNLDSILEEIKAYLKMNTKEIEDHIKKLDAKKLKKALDDGLTMDFIIKNDLCLTMRMEQTEHIFIIR
jgi:hypothetical protein